MSVAKRLANISLDDDFSVNTVLSNVPTKTLISLYLADNRGVERNENWKKNDLKKLITPAITSAATKYLVESLTSEQLAAAIEPLNIDHTKKRNNPNSRKVQSKRLTESLMDTGIAEFWEKYGETPQLKGIAESLGLEPASTKSEIIAQIAEHVEAEGLRVYFSSFTEEILRDVAFDMKLEKDPLAMNSKQVLVECILHNHEVPEKPKKKKAVVKLSKTKPELEKGVRYEDVFQHYTVEELHDWAKKNGLKTTGAKPELIRRILQFFDGDKENIMAGQRKAPKRRKSAAPKKKAAPKDEKETTTKKAAPAKETKKVTPPPKPEPVEEEEDEEEVEEEVEEEEEAEDLDLDNLEGHSIAQLKKYCEDEDIAVKGTSKKAYIDAIVAYNNEQDEDEEEI